MKRFVVPVFVVWAILVTPALAGGPEDLANRISAEVMSPYCPGVTLHDCPSDAAVQLRERILGWAEDGWSRDRILNRLEAEYGASIRSTPPASGTGLWAWVMPAVVVIGGLATASIVAMRWSRRRRPGAAPYEPTASQRSRLDSELAQAREQL
jgi:cytochrome c-type biogenesis protein CcmH/NrfF